MLQGIVYFCPATEFKRTAFLVGSKGGRMQEWARDVEATNQSCARFADVQLGCAVRAWVDGAWDEVWLHDHVVRRGGCWAIPDDVVAHYDNDMYEVVFVYPTRTLHLSRVDMQGMTRIRQWFHHDIVCRETPLDVTMLYPSVPLRTLPPPAAQTVAATPPSPPACPCTGLAALVETVRSGAATPPPPGSDGAPTTTRT